MGPGDAAGTGLPVGCLDSPHASRFRVVVRMACVPWRSSRNQRKPSTLRISYVTANGGARKVMNAFISV